MSRILPGIVTALAALAITGCVTPINWNARIGVYTYNQAVMDYGPPRSLTTLSDRSFVAEWMTERSMVVATPSPYYYGPGSYYGGGFYYGYYGPAPAGNSTYFPAQFLRLNFSADGRLRGWKEFSK